jgi:DNA-binding response OmpR family regulator
MMLAAFNCDTVEVKDGKTSVYNTNVQPWGDRYILVVEDDQALRDLYRSTLRAAGYAVVGVEDGLDALRVIERGKPHAVVLDLALPRLGGREVLSDLRANATTRNIPIIIVTGMEYSEVDPNDFACVLTKPVSPNALVEAVEKCLTNARSVTK